MNEREFFAATVENFFKRPQEFKSAIHDLLHNREQTREPGSNLLLPSSQT